MSRIGKLPVKLPEGVELESSERKITIKGPRGSLERKLSKGVLIKKDSLGQCVVSVKGGSKAMKALHGTTRANIANMVEGVSKGWSKTLEMVGTGYRAEVKGNTLILTVGFSHPVEIVAPDGITFSVTKTEITVQGIDKEVVGSIAAKIRSVRPPEPYKGKGIRYKGEFVRRKVGKAAKTVGAPA